MSCNQKNCADIINQAGASAIVPSVPSVDRGQLYKLPYEEAKAILLSESEKTDKRSFKEGLTVIMETLDVSPIIFTNDKGEQEEAQNLVFANVGYRNEDGEIATQWGCAILKDQLDQMGVGKQCVVFTHDAVPPETEQFKFLEKWHGRIKMQRLKGAASEVLAMPLDAVFPGYDGSFVNGQDVTVMTGTLKYEKPLPGGAGGDIIGHFVPEIEKSDEDLFQSEPGRKAMRAMHGRQFYATIKSDGTSGTTVFRPKGAIIRDANGSIVKENDAPEFIACSRNYQLARTASDNPSAIPVVWQAVNRYHLDEKLAELNRHIAIQFEVGGPGIQKNRMGWNAVDLRVFTIKDPVTGTRLPYYEMVEICDKLGLPMVEIAQLEIDGKMVDAVNLKFDAGWSDDSLRRMAEGLYPNTATQREGVVFRTMENDKPSRGGYNSFKVINLKYKD